ncbi:cadherin-like beta sandwich domain-containing protein [Nubsella zeaxanthinifaciens]|uniref:cadherin-like beta sandwich domain-containing protein n=1 Tax=Nubsella zeaxanthinifaciens TaxID=392412 RepID=UPI001BE127E2|nr:cadherin-like beta sandwich domain-containing protein [Nubsella zeaxanthinifaciens]
MIKMLLINFFKKCFSLLLLATGLISLASEQTMAQATVLAQGDISIIGFNSSDNRGVSFVVWKAINTGTEIRFTDNGFNSSSSSTSASNIRWQETVLIWTATENIDAGKVITIENETTNYGTANVINSTGLDPGVTALGLSNNAGDQIFAYQGLNMPTTTTATTGNQTFNNTILFGLGYQGNSVNTSWITSGTTATSTSYLPSDLVAPNRIYLAGNATAGQYTGARTGFTVSQLKSLIADPTNWTNLTGLGTIVTYNTASFATGTSNNANLSGFTLSQGTLSPAFSASQTSYTATVMSGTTSITITPTAAQGNATIKVNGTTVTSGNASGNIALALGSNVITIEVTAQDGTTIKTYTVTVTRESTLPVTLLSFTGKAQADGNYLQWRTTAERDNKGYIIYRKVAGNDYKLLDRLAPNLSDTYYFTDKNPPVGNSYYQLVQEDLNGTATILGELVIKSLQDAEIRIFPNPATETTTVSYASGVYTKIELVDLNGRIFYTKELNPGSGQHDITVSGLPKGTYVISLKGNGLNNSLKFIKN